MQGGNITINGAGSTDTVVTMNSITVTGGQNSINTLPYINEGSTVKLTIGNLIRNTTNHSGINFNGFTTNNSGGSNTLGGQGLTTNGNIIINQVNGAAFSSANLVNNLIGGWAVADGSAFATYDNTYGVVAMGNTYGGFSAPGFTGTDVSAALVATGNYNDGTATRTLAAGAVVSNSWRFSPGATQTITFPTTTTATLGVGIITNANFGITLAATDATNTLTGSGSDLYFYINQNTTAIQPAITGGIALVSNGPATLSLRPQFASNTYSGGTFVQGGTLNLQAAGAFIAIPGDLTITNAALTMSTTPNQIATSSNVVINGGGSFTLANYTTGPTQTLNSFTFNNEGGSANPTLSLGTPTTLTSTLVLSSATPITATNNSLATTPTISTGAATLTALQFSDANPVITVNAGLALTGLTISAPITQHVNMLSLSKSGTGALALSGANTFTTGFNLNQGSLIFGASSTPTSGTVTSGPVGTGTLTIAGGTTVLSDGTARTIANATTVNGDFTFGGVVSGNGLTLSGAMNLGSTGRTITVTSPAVTSTISGAITSTATGTAITKAGAGTLVFTSATNNLNGAEVAVSAGILKNGVDNAIPNNSQINVSAGAGYDLNGFNQASLQIAGTGFITNSANSSRTLTLGGASATDVATNVSSAYNGVLTDNRLAQASSALAVTKAGIGTLTLGGTLNNYFGATTIVAGTLAASVDNALSPNSTVIVGNTTTGTLTATLDLSSTSQAIAGLQAVNNNATGSASIIIGSGKTLTVNGPVTLGANTSATDTTNVNFSGGGNLVVNSSGGTFQVGGGTGATNTNAAIVDMSSLASFTANLGTTGVLRVGDVNSPTTGGSSVLTLAPVSSITAGTLNIGEATGQSNLQTLKLGSTSNVINVDTINVGTNTNRGAGDLSFATGTGTLTVRAANGTGRATLNLTNGSASTAAALNSTMNLNGHSADLLLSTVTLAARSAGTTGGATATFSFDTGTMDATSTVLTSRTGSTLTTGALSSTMNIGGGSALLGAPRGGAD